MKRDRVDDFEASLIGRSCSIGRLEHGWAFDLFGGVALTVSAPWRILSDGRIALASGDDGQLFGLTSPVDGEAAARGLLRGKTITAAVLDRRTADLALQFDAATRVEVFNDSMGFEGWQAEFVLADERFSLIAVGGGGVAVVAGWHGGPAIGEMIDQRSSGPGEADWRDLDERESAVLDHLLASDFPGRAEIAAQARTAQVRRIDRDGSLRFKVEGPRAGVRGRVPVEGRYHDDGTGPGPHRPAVTLLLHVVEGCLHELEAYKDDGAVLIGPFEVPLAEIEVEPR